ncbi:MAG: hypothetical protein WCO71_08300, partial [Pseudomonadota bacterium]
LIKNPHGWLVYDWHGSDLPLDLTESAARKGYPSPDPEKQFPPPAFVCKCRTKKDALTTVKQLRARRDYFEKGDTKQ